MQKIIFSIVIFWVITGTASATLIIRGSDILGNQLIYDDVQDITWYDHSFTGVNWSTFPGAFATQFGGLTLDGWRLPKHLVTPVTCWAHSLTDCSVTTDELGYLWKDELGNPFGDLPSYGLTYQKGPFTDLSLETQWYWLEGAWYINFNAKDHGHLSGAAVLLVRDGDVAAAGVPEPWTPGLLMSGMMLMGWARRRNA